MLYLTANGRWAVEAPTIKLILSMEFTNPDMQLRLVRILQKESVMQSLDLERPEPTLAAWSRVARPIHIGHLRDAEVGSSPLHPPVAPLYAQLDDLLFGFSATILLLVPLAFSPLAAWLR